MPFSTRICEKLEEISVNYLQKGDGSILNTTTALGHRNLKFLMPFRVTELEFCGLKYSSSCSSVTTISVPEPNGFLRFSEGATIVSRDPGPAPLFMTARVMLGICSAMVHKSRCVQLMPMAVESMRFNYSQIM